MKFIIKRGDLKQYPHFDAPLSVKEVNRLVIDPIRVAQNSFYPFFMYYKEWQPFRAKPAGKPDKKRRPIRYGSRRDSYIFAYYRDYLSQLYEKKLNTLGIEDCPVAYRKIKKSDGGGKCNIDFAKDAFDTIDALEDCIAICMDIKGYFESLDHNIIKKIWCELLGVANLPPDHYAVFKNITKYRYVEQKEVYKRLGFWGYLNPDKPAVECYAKDIPKQLCSPKDFREKICGRNKKYSSLVHKNTDNFGIPQGAPISDIIANFYLLYFDVCINEYVRERGGKYIRYSDDILLIIPKEKAEVIKDIEFVEKEIQNYGSQIKIKKEKTSISEFYKDGNGISFRSVDMEGVKNNKDGLEYLGFRYDGKKVYIRESTVSRFHRKISHGSKVACRKYVEANPGKKIPNLIKEFNFSLFYQKYGKVDSKSYNPDDYRSWTFYSYMKRSREIFGEKGSQITKQFANFKKFTRERVALAITDSFNKI